MTQAESDQPALGPDGQLLDASKIVWFNDPDDPHPIRPTSMEWEGMILTSITFWWQLTFLLGQGQHLHPIHATTGTQYAEAITAEKVDEFGSSTYRFIQPRVAKMSAKCKQWTATNTLPSDSCNVIDSDAEDLTFTTSVSEDGSESKSGDLNSDGIEIGNQKICFFLSWVQHRLIWVQDSGHASIKNDTGYQESKMPCIELEDDHCHRPFKKESKIIIQNRGRDHWRWWSAASDG